MAPEGHGVGNPGDMRVALVSRTVVLVGWLLAVLWHGIREPAGIVVALALLMLWAAAFARDSRFASPASGWSRQIHGDCAGQRPATTPR
jgi:hypothetical protein